MRGNAYSNFTQFINPVRPPNTTVYLPRRQPRRPVQPRVHATVVNTGRPPQVVGQPARRHNLAGLQARNPMLTVSKRIDQIKQEKEELLDRLRENDNLEKKLLDESEAARRKRETESLERIHKEVRLLKERIHEKELQEKWILDKTRQEKESQEKRELENVHRNREELVRKLTSAENRITEIRDQSALERLKQEKEEMTRKWKNIEEEERARHERDEMEKKAEILRQQEQREIEQLELARLQNETKQLRNALDSKSNEQLWLEKRQPAPPPPPSSVASTVESVKPKTRTITRRRNKAVTSTACVTGCGREKQLFQSSDRSIDARVQQLTKEAGTYREPTPSLAPSEKPAPTPSRYQQMFDELQRELHQQRNLPKSEADSERLDFTYRTLAMLKSLQQTPTPKVDGTSDTQSCGCNGKTPSPSVTPSVTHSISPDDSASQVGSHKSKHSVLPSQYGSLLDDDTDDEDVKSTLTVLSKIISETKETP